MTYTTITITYIVKGKPKEMKLTVTDETREMILAERIEEIMRAHKITERDITVQGGLL